MGFRSLLPFILIITALVIIFTYIKPTYESMTETQAETAKYQVALERANSFNEELQRLLNSANRFSSSELRALERYIPDTIDVIAVMRDVETIVENNDMILAGLAAGEVREAERTAARSQADFEPGLDDEELLGELPGSEVPLEITSPRAQDFTLSVTGSYEQLKLLLQDFERNAYPLEVTTLTFTPQEEELYTYDLTLETYALPAM
ncbi:hypothetical protein N9L26_01890, partial [Candidatus Pacebacteria bacterium]|nr:hypothetical protein [Candidatus Paceibacterota bacterium]